MSAENIEIRPLSDADWERVRDIYIQGLATGLATFETTAPSWEQWDAGHLKSCRLAAASEQFVAGWCALSPISKRQAYSGVAEVSVYVAEEYRGLGLGRALLDALVAESESNGIWTLQASIFPENAASIAIHQRCGFRKIGLRERVAELNGIWRDTVLLERRSQKVGVD
ncbi:MAG TPA: GNAT family N-acetyltransferase [Pyrinomonadaceae bacterium]|nr:GNAT family N-acetyltransferase [Pyrinomonadaceae bacterium]